MVPVIDEIDARRKKFERAKEIGEKYAPLFAGTSTRYQPPLSNYNDESAWIPDPKEPSSPRFNDGLAAVGLRWRRHEIVVDRWKPPRAGTVIDKTMRTKYAACAALGLSYWCDGYNGRTIAVDQHQRFVDIKINQKERTVFAYGRGGIVDFTVGDNEATLDLLAADQPDVPDLPAHGDPVPEHTDPEVHDRLAVQTAIAGITHDNSYVIDVGTTLLYRIIDKARYFNGARDILPLITAELERRKLAIA